MLTALVTLRYRNSVLPWGKRLLRGANFKG